MLRSRFLVSRDEVFDRLLEDFLHLFDRELRLLLPLDRLYTLQQNKGNAFEVASDKLLVVSNSFFLLNALVEHHQHFSDQTAPVLERRFVYFVVDV